MPKYALEKIMKIIKNHVSLNCKNIHIQCKKNIGFGLAGCARERKMYQATIKKDSLNVPTSMKNKCWIYAKKGDANENGISSKMIVSIKGISWLKSLILFLFWQFEQKSNRKPKNIIFFIKSIFWLGTMI